MVLCRVGWARGLGFRGLIFIFIFIYGVYIGIRGLGFVCGIYIGVVSFGACSCSSRQQRTFKSIIVENVSDYRGFFRVFMESFRFYKGHKELVRFGAQDMRSPFLIARNLMISATNCWS